jgi:transcriptional regulator with XRE-family HTH domain
MRLSPRARTSARLRADSGILEPMRSREEIQDAKILGQALVALRVAKGLSQAQVVQRARVSRQALSNIENGRNQPSQATLKKVLRAIGVSHADLLSAQGPFRESRGLPGTLDGMDPDDALLAAMAMAEEAKHAAARCLALLEVATRKRSAASPLRRVS